MTSNTMRYSLGLNLSRRPWHQYTSSCTQRDRGGECEDVQVANLAEETAKTLSSPLESPSIARYGECHLSLQERDFEQVEELEEVGVCRGVEDDLCQKWCQR